MDGRIEILLGLGVIVQSEINSAKVRVSGGAKLCVGREAEDITIARRGLLQIAVLLRIDSEIELAGGVAGFQGGGSAEVRDGFVEPALLDERAGKVIFRDKIVLGDGKGMRPESEIVVPVADLSVSNYG